MYLMTCSTHFCLLFMMEANVFNDALNMREMFYLTMHSTHFIYGYMASDIWLRTILIVRKETRCRHIGYSSINSCGGLAGMRISQWVHHEGTIR